MHAYNKSFWCLYVACTHSSIFVVPSNRYSPVKNGIISTSPAEAGERRKFPPLSRGNRKDKWRYGDRRPFVFLLLAELDCIELASQLHIWYLAIPCTQLVHFSVLSLGGEFPQGGLLWQRILWPDFLWLLLKARSATAVLWEQFSWSPCSHSFPNLTSVIQK